ncbi:MAG: PAS domain S-box protein, partial [Gammaproteobacteria bacterium]
MSAIIHTDADNLSSSQPQINVSTFSHGPVVVFRWRNVSGWPVEFVTPNVSELLGYTVEELLDSAICYGDIVYPDDWQRVQTGIEKHDWINSVEQHHEHYRIATSRGDIRWVEHYIQAELNAEQQITHYNGYVIDVTSRKSAEQDMLAMLDAASDMMFKVNQNGTIVDYYARNNHDLSMPPEAFLGKRMVEVLPETVACEGMEHLERALKTGKVSSHQYVMPTMNGSIRDFEARYVAKGENEVVVVVRDITQDKLAQQALRKRETQLNLIADQLHAVFWAVDRGLRFTMSHGAGLRRLGLLSHEVIGMSLFDYFQTQDPEFKPIANVIRALNGESTSFNQTWSNVTYQTFVEPLRDEKGEIAGAVGISLDITDRQMSERRLTESETRFKDIAENMSDWIWEVDANGIYTYCSERIEDILGYRPEEIVGRTPFDLMPKDEAAKLAARFAEIRANKLPIKNLENWNLTRDGRRVCLLTNGIPLFDDGGNLVGYRGVDSDITERKLTMEALVHAKEEAEVASQAKSQFLSRMSHELRTPLNAILGYSELLMDPEEEPITNNQRATVNTIHTAGHHLLSLINEILDLAKIEAGKLAIVPEAVPWREILDRCFELAKPEAESMNIRLNIEAPASVPVNIYADGQRFKQVLLNLISNAIKYNKPGGAVTIGIDQDQRGQTRFDVRDTGIGLSKDQMRQLFQPFNRLAP